MPALLEYYIEQLDAKCDHSRTDLGNAAYGMALLGDEIYAQDWSAAHNACDYVAGELSDLYHDLLDPTASARYWLRMALEYINDYVSWDIPEVDMSAILKAMEEAEPHQPLLFVAYLEAYYASVWNASFDERFFADLVKKWSIWE